MRRTAALILGGGPAGSAAAIALARGGVTPLLIERTRETGDALCGGFLSWRTLESLAALGIAADDLNRERVTRIRMFAGQRRAETALPYPALGVTRRRLDALLLARADAEGVQVERGVAVRAVDGTTARLDDGAEIASDALLLATGKHDVRGTARPVSDGDPWLGVRVRLAASPTIARLVGDAIELHLFDRGYAGLVRHEDGSANLCLAVRRSRLREAGDPRALLDLLAADSPALDDRLAQLAADPTIDAVANVPYGWRVRDTAAGLYRLGDQAAVIPSLAGEGMGIAIASGRAAAHAILSGESAPQFQQRFANTVAWPMQAASFVRRLTSLSPTLTVAIAGIAPPVVRATAALTRIDHKAVDA